MKPNQPDTPLSGSSAMLFLLGMFEVTIRDLKQGGDMSKEIVPHEVLASKIFLIRGHKVMLDRDLAQLYGIEPKRLNEQVKRNRKRFPPDFMLQLTKEEGANVLRSQNATLKKGRGMHLKYLPFAFTENGVAMLSSVLNSERAIEVNIQIMRTFTKLRELLNTHADLRRKLEEMEKKYDYQFKVIFDAIKSLISTPDEPAKKIGFTAKS